MSEGEVIAPPAKVEAMYEPSRHGLSDYTVFQIN